jgi:UDP-N-acetyl-D-mannosaminuronic acid dehydrogenase
MDNTYRDVMFSYANQMALLCEALGLDMVPLVRSANQGYNRNNIPVPSPGVGGACLSKDPYILASVCKKAGVDPSLFLIGRRINEFMPINVCNRVVAELNNRGRLIKGANVLVLGFSFKGKPETSDIRDSPTLDLIARLKEMGAVLRGHDPLVPKEEIEALGVKFFLSWRKDSMELML